MIDKLISKTKVLDLKCASESETDKTTSFTLPLYIMLNECHFLLNLLAKNHGTVNANYYSFMSVTFVN